MSRKRFSRGIFLLLISLMILFVSPIHKCNAKEDSFIEFTDKHIEEQVRYKLNKPNGNITKKDLLNIRKLYFTYEQINLDELKYFTNLESLTLRYMYIFDISFLKPLVNLEELDLMGNCIKDISVLKDLKKLKELSLDYNGISDISPLENLDKLTFLSLYRNDISDISKLKNLRNLKALWITDNNISNIKVVENFNKLTSLFMAGNNIKDVSPIQNLINLIELKAGGIKNFDIRYVKELNNLTSLSLSSNNISDISYLKNLHKLSYLAIANNNIENIDCLANLKNLKELHINNNKIKSIKVLDNLSELRTLSLSGNCIEDYSPIIKYYDKINKDFQLKFLIINDELIKKSVICYINSTNAYINGYKMKIDDNDDVVPYITNRRTLVPIRFISESFNAKVFWDKKTQTVTIKKDKNIIKAKVGSKKLLINGIEKDIDVSVEIKNSRTYLPLRNIAEALNKHVIYKDNLIVISDNEEIKNINDDIVMDFITELIIDREMAVDLKIKYIIKKIIKSGMSDLEKEIAIHDYIILNSRYELNKTSVYDLLINGYGNCVSYAKATKLLLESVGIECKYITGDISEKGIDIGHAWNIVKINGNYYHVDVLWDEASRNNRIKYDYFNLSDDQLKEKNNGRDWDKDKFPKCNSNYFEYMHNEYKDL
jgi:internalin A